MHGTVTVYAVKGTQEVRLGVAAHWVPMMECLWPVCTPRKHHFRLRRHSRVSRLTQWLESVDLNR